MASTIYNEALSHSFEVRKPGISVLKKFMNWTTNQQHNNLLWAGIAVGGHGCILTPLTILVIAFTGMSLPLFMIAIVAMCMCLVTNLAAMPTRVTIPVFFISLLIDLGIVVAALSSLA